MRINELLTIRYNSELNPEIWDGFELKKEVRLKLLTAAKDFITYLDVDAIDIQDVVITGSNANYNWTELSDIDLHIIVNMEEVKSRCPDLADDFFQSKKSLWNQNHEITIYGHDVELYAQDATEEHVSGGFFSVLDNKWITKPEHSVPVFNNSAVEAKAEQFKYEIEELISVNADMDAVRKMKTKIKNMRRSGLQGAGEFSTENLAFKQLRYSGHLKMLSDYAKGIVNKKYSLDKDILDKRVDPVL